MGIVSILTNLLTLQVGISGNQNRVTFGALRDIVRVTAQWTDSVSSFWFTGTRGCGQGHGSKGGSKGVVGVVVVEEATVAGSGCSSNGNSTSSGIRMGIPAGIPGMYGHSEESIGPR